MIPITPEGLEKFKKEKETLLEKRKTAVVNLRTAREMGDLSENAAYKVARHELSSIDSRLRRLEYILRLSTVIVTSNSDTIGIGKKVKLANGPSVLIYTLTGSYESDPANGKISHLSPIGKSIIGRKKGDMVTVNTPNGQVTYKVEDVSL